MLSCQDTYYLEVALCDQTFLAAYAACNGDPQCQLLAIQKHRACQDAAYLKYMLCLGQTSATSTEPPTTKCPCDGDGGADSGGGD